MKHVSAPSLVVTQGDPAGVGPELLLRVAAEGALAVGDLVVADPDVLRAVAYDLTAPWAKVGWSAIEPLLVGGAVPNQVGALERGVDLVLGRSDRALVTAPIDKAAAWGEGLRHPGHTEYLAARSAVRDFAMLMAGPRLRVTLATIHVALRDVPARLTTEAVERVGRLLIEALTDRFHISIPRVGVLGCNPHAGERGLLGDEETRVIAPAIDELRRRFTESAIIEGPLPADTAFHDHLEGRYDGLVAMYHDQALAPFKLLHFRDGVNVTLGLPFVRTSPDHGTARDIARTGRADPSSMMAAIRLARELAT